MNTLTKENITGISALLVHAAKIDDNILIMKKISLKSS